MKLVIRSELPAELQETLKDSRFVLMLPDVWGIPEIISHGNDPVLVSQAGIKPTFEIPNGDQKMKIIEDMETGASKTAAYQAAGVKITSAHVYTGNGQVAAPNGILYRIDEARRGE
jgi:hypothetical protein